MLADLLTAVVGADEMRVRCDSATARYTLALAAGVGLTDPTPPGDLTPWVTVTIVVIPGNAKGEWTDTTGGTAIGVL